MSNRVYFRGSREDARQVAHQLTRILTGQDVDSHGIARGVFLAMGFAALSDVKDDFIRKSRGGTGEDGRKWAPLSPVTIANRKVDAREARANPDIRERAKIVRREKRRILQRLLLSMPREEAEREADRQAQAAATRQTGKTKVDVLGGRNVEILRETGALFNSLSPGKISSPGPFAVYTKPLDKGGDEQILETISNGVVVGTNVPYAGTHQYGNAERNIPARPFLPDENNVPPAWLDRWGEATSDALLVGARLAFEVLQ